MIIKIIPGEALISLEVKPETSTIQSIFPVTPKIVNTNPPIRHNIPLQSEIKVIMNSYLIADIPNAVLETTGSISA